MKIFNCIAIVLIISTTLVTSAVANELKILVVVTENVEALYDGNNLFATIENEVGDAIEEAVGARPNIVLSHIRPQLAEPAISGSALLQLAHLPPISTQRDAQSADLVLIVPIVYSS